MNFLARKRGFPNSPLFPTLEMKFTEIALKVKQKLGFFGRRVKIDFAISPPSQ